MLIFAYGSLNKDYEDKIVTPDYVLKWYQRVLNAIIDDWYVYYNLVENPVSSVVGDILDLDADDMYTVLEREIGYDLINMGEFRTFISRNTIGVVKQTYIDKSK